MKTFFLLNYPSLIENILGNILKKGCLLIAEPSILGDHSFTRSVILLSEHNQEGSVGFIINKPTNYTLDELVHDVDASFTVFNGGPVAQDNLYFIHNVPEIIPNSVEISKNIYWGGDYETTLNAINERKISKENIRFFLGYSGWELDQLQIEINQKAWIVTSNKHNIFKKAVADLWKKEILNMGGEYAVWSNAPENPNLN